MLRLRWMLGFYDEVGVFGGGFVGYYVVRCV